MDVMELCVAVMGSVSLKTVDPQIENIDDKTQFHAKKNPASNGKNY